jgi:hypothetical protein
MMYCISRGNFEDNGKSVSIGESVMEESDSDTPIRSPNKQIITFFWWGNARRHAQEQ